MIGTRLAGYLKTRGYRVVILSRRKKPVQPGADGPEYALWDPKAGTVEPGLIEQADHIINLAGVNLMDHKWTKSFKKEILESRTAATSIIAGALQSIPNHVKSVINGSAIGWYGEDKKKGYSFTEEDPADSGFLGSVCREWEGSLPDQIGNTRICKIRTGIVLSSRGGFIGQLSLPVKYGIAPVMSNGRQILSWIHIDDLCGIILFLMENNLRGVYNAVAPHPESNKEITLEYARAVRGKFFIPVHVPSPALKLALGERAIEVLKSTRVSCEKIMQAGYRFRFPDPAAAIRDVAAR